MLVPESGQGNAFVQISTYRFYCIWRFRTRWACSRAWHPAPGWYPGRTVHIHAKLHLETQTVLTTQFYFADDFTDRVFSREPSASATPATRFNDSDPLYQQVLELTLAKEREAYPGRIAFDASSA
jgi:protocatechuate 3,4-dioxygenase beta subunit